MLPLPTASCPVGAMVAQEAGVINLLDARRWIGPVWIVVGRFRNPAWDTFAAASSRYGQISGQPARSGERFLSAIKSRSWVAAFRRSPGGRVRPRAAGGREDPHAPGVTGARAASCAPSDCNRPGSCPPCARWHAGTRSGTSSAPTSRCHAEHPRSGMLRTRAALAKLQLAALPSQTIAT